MGLCIMTDITSRCAGVTCHATRPRCCARPRQLGPVLYEDAPQELRSRLWMALLADPSLTGNLQAERVSACLVRPLCPSLTVEDSLAWLPLMLQSQHAPLLVLRCDYGRFHGQIRVDIIPWTLHGIVLLCARNHPMRTALSLQHHCSSPQT